MKNRISHLLQLPAAAALALAACGTSSAADKYWDFGAASSTLWSNVANWDTNASGSGGNPSTAPGANDNAIFNITPLNTNQIATLGANISLTGLVFNNTGTTTINTDGGTNRRITLGAGGITINSGAGAVTFGTSVQSFRVPFTLSANQTWTNNSSNTFAIQNQNIISTGGFTLSFAGSGDITNASLIEGLGGITKNSANTLALTYAASSYTGVTTINSGTLDAASFAAGGVNSSLGASSSAAANLVFGGGTLRHSVATVASTDRLFTIGNASGNTATVDSSAALATNSMSFTNSGAIAFGTTNAHTLTLTGTNTGANTIASLIGDNIGATSIIKEGSGTWTLTAANTYTGDTTVNLGTLVLANDSQSVFKIGANGVNNTISGTGTLILDGYFTFELSGAGKSLGDSWNIVSVATLNETFGTTFSISGFSHIGGDIWQGVSGGATYQFSQATGLLSVTAIPEPSTWALLIGTMVIAMTMRRRIA